MPLLLYADDIVLLASSPAMVARILSCVEDYASRWHFDVNHGKSNVMVIGTQKEQNAARDASGFLVGYQ